MTDSALSASHSRMVTGLFDSRDRAECAYQSAMDLGYEKSEINVAMSDETRQRFFPSEQPKDTELSDKAAESAEGSSKLAHELGGPAGGTIGIMAPVLAALGTLAIIPGVILAGPVAVALAAAGAVGVAGGLIGALVDWGIPEDRVHRYETDIRSGAILLGLKAHSDADANELERHWKACGAELVQG